MPEFKDMLKYFRTQEKLSQSELAQKLGIATSTISMYEVGKREPDFETEEKIADFFHTDLNTLRGRNTINKSKSSLKNGECFELTISDDSMEPRIYKDDLVIVHPQNEAESGEIIIATINENKTICKRLTKYAGGIALGSLNAKYEPMMFTNEDIENKTVKIVGKVIELRSKL